MLFPDTISEELLEVVTSRLSLEHRQMNRGEFNESEGFGSVKAAIDFYRGKIPDENVQLKKSKMGFSEKPSSRIGELHQARNRSGILSETKRLAESAKNEAESALLNAKKTVKELTKRIEESNSRAKAQTEVLEKLKKTRRGEEDRSGASTKDEEDNQYFKMMRELENTKQELSRLKVDLASLVEEKGKAEKEIEACNEKAQTYSNVIEVLTSEIEKHNEEHVLVELARLEATKEQEAIELQRQEAAKEHSAKLDETRKKISDMIKEIERGKEFERILAITTSETDVLGDELKEVREMDRRIQRTENLEVLDSSLQQKEQSQSSSLLLSVSEELEAAKQELDSVKAESIQLMASMDIIRKELNGIMDQIVRLSRKEARTDLTIQNLNSKFLRAKAKLEAASAAEESAQSIVSNLFITLEKLKSEADAAEKERIHCTEEASVLKAEAQKTESELDPAEERFQAALQELETVRTAEARALESLKLLSEKTMKNRALASQRSSKITISTFEYEYLTGCAIRAAEIADKKVAAAQAWVEALKASEKEILMKMESAQREIPVENQKVIKTEQSLSAERIVESELENSRQKFANIPEYGKFQAQMRSSRKSMTGNIKFTPSGRAKFQMSGSPAVRHTKRAASFSTNRRTKVMPNLAKFFSGKSIEGNLQATAEFT